MDNLVKVDFHIHSNFSDGMFSPEILADELTVAKVEYAALTDHDNIDGLQRFTSAAEAQKINCINGVEISAGKEDAIYHLLAYGFNIMHHSLHRELARNYKHLHPTIYALLDKAKSLLYHFSGKDLPQASCLISVEDALALIHDAGGCAFLAHPLTCYHSDEQFCSLILELKEQGLDGMEVYYKQYSSQQMQMLLDKADKYGLITSAGSDFHGDIQPRLMNPGILISRERLEQFYKVLAQTDRD